LPVLRFPPLRFDLVDLVLRVPVLRFSSVYFSVLCFPVCIFHWFDLVFRLPVLRFSRLHFYGPASPYTHTGAGYQPTRRLVEVVAVAEEHPVRSVPAVWSGADRDVFQPDAGRSEEQVSTTRSTSRTYQVDQTTTLRCIFKGAFRAT